MPYVLCRVLLQQGFPGAFPFQIWDMSLPHWASPCAVCHLFLLHCCSAFTCSPKILITHHGCKGKSMHIAFHIDLETRCLPTNSKDNAHTQCSILWFRSQENYLSLARAQAQHSLNRSLFQCRIWHYFRTGNLKILKYSLAANFCLKEVAPQGTCGRKLTTENIQFSAWVKKRWAMYRLVY